LIAQLEQKLQPEPVPAQESQLALVQELALQLVQVLE
jgi:hypothetical protein